MRPPRSRIRLWISVTGGLVCGTLLVAWGASMRWDMVWQHHRRVLGECAWSDRMGLTWRVKAERSRGRSAFAAPLWMLFTAAFGLTAGLYRLARPRLRPGSCRVCGYDLTGNLSGRCPECGTELP